MGFNEKPIFIKVSVILTAVGVLLDLIGFATAYWSKHGIYHAGLWSYSSWSNLPTGLLTGLLGFATDYWIRFEYDDVYGNHVEEYGGLWRSCGDSFYNHSKDRLTFCFASKVQSWFEATQAFETLGFIAAIVALVLIVLYVFVPQTSGKKIVFILAMLACFAAAGCIILGIIIYGSKMDNLSWSFALCCIAGIIFGVSGVLLVVDMLKR